MCNQCMDNKTWDKPIDGECRICGKDRTFAWSTSDFNETKVDVKRITEDPLRDFLEWGMKHWKKAKPKKARKQNANKGRRVRPQRGGNPFIDMEAGDEEQYDSSDDQDVLQLLGQNYTINDDGIEGREQSDNDDDDDQSEWESDTEETTEDGPRNHISGFMEKTRSEEPQILDEDLTDVPGPSNAFRNSPAPSIPEAGTSSQLDPVQAKNSRLNREIYKILVEKGLWPSMEEQEAARQAEEEARREEEEEKRKAEEEAKMKKEERRKNREVPTYIYCHYGQKYDNVGYIFILIYISFRFFSSANYSTWAIARR